MENNQISDKLKQINSGIDFKRILGSLMSKWHWFVISLFITLTTGYLYLRYTVPVYSVNSLVLIEDKSKGVGSLVSSLNQSSDAGAGNKTNLFNEMFVLTSQDLVSMVVDSLGLNVKYFAQGRIREDELYKTSPVKIVFDSAGYTGEGFLELRLTQRVEGLFEITEADITSNALYNSWITRPYGRFKIVYSTDKEANKGYLENKTEIIVRIIPKKSMVDEIQGRFHVNISDGRTSLLDLSMTDNIPGRGVDFLNVLIYNYRKKELEDLNTAANKTREFINRQKANLIAELQSRDSIEEEIKTQNRIIDLKSQTSVIMTERSAQQERVQQLLFQRQTVNELKENILNGVGSRYEVMAGTGLLDPVINGLVNEYNELIQRKELLERNTAPLHPSLIKIKNDIAALRKNIADASDRVIASLNANIQNAAGSIARYNESMASIPAAERSINNTKREYPLIQNVYLYLYQRGVENDISQYAATNNSKVVVEPYASDAPIKPVRKSVFTMAFLIGILIPGAVVIARVMLNNKVINERDIESLTSLPVIGTIARISNTEEKQIVVGPHIRTGIAEQFRLIRANLEFMSASATRKNYLITSSMSGEGKTFISLNLGITMTLAKKRVVIMEFDLRKPKLSAYLGLKNEGGISAYLAGLCGIEQVIKASGVHENLYVANCGPIPPNPGELLVLPATRNLIAELQEMFDIIIMDTAPIGLVSDALILSQYSDINMFVVRQSYTIKEQIRLFNNLYTEGKIPNAAVIFNGVEYRKKYGYGYSGTYYGYQFGEGYYEENHYKKKTLIDRLFKN